MTITKKRKKLIMIASVAAVVAIICAVIILIVMDKKDDDIPLPDTRLIYKGDPELVADMDDERRSTFIVGVSTMLTDSRPYKQNSEAGGLLRELVYTPLMSVDGANVEYRLADSIVISGGGLEAEVTLKQGAVFSDGEGLTAERVAESYKWFMEEDTGYIALVHNIRTVEAVSDSELKFTFYAADADIVGAFQIPIVHVVESDTALGEVFAGAGDYVIDSYSPSKEILLRRREGADVTYEQVLIKQINYADPSEKLAAQSVDMFLITKTELYEEVKSNGAYDVTEYSGSAGWYLVYETDDTELKNAAAAVAKSKEMKAAAAEIGVYSKGIVSAYMEDGYFSMLPKTGDATAKRITVACGYDGASVGIADVLERSLNEQGAECSKIQLQDLDERKESYGADIAAVHGKWQDFAGDKAVNGLFSKQPQVQADVFYTELERYMTENNLITPISKDTTWRAILAGREPVIDIE